MTAPLIEARKLARWFGAVVGVTDVDLDVPAGIVGLLGPNGAGKSTLLKLLTGQLIPSAGTVKVLGMNPVREADVFQRVGFCSEDDVLFEDLTPREMLRFLGRLRGYDATEARRRADRALERCGIIDAADRRTRGFSKGMRQRTRIAAALLHEPDILLLDEPMTGLDPVGRRAVVELVRTWAAEQRTVVFSSHILHEVESVATYVVVLDRGMVLAEGTPAHIKSCFADYAFTLEIRGTRLRTLAQHLVLRADVSAVEIPEPELVRVSTSSAKSLLPALPGIILDTGVEVRAISAPEENLEALFRRLVK